MGKLRDDLLKILPAGKRGTGSLPAVQRRDAIPAARGDADYQTSTADGGGIVSPLTEEPDKRKFYATEQTWTDPTGVFVIVYSNLMQTTVKDAENTEHDIILTDE
jgi:hypothetical protein